MAPIGPPKKANRRLVITPSSLSQLATFGAEVRQHVYDWLLDWKDTKDHDNLYIKALHIMNTLYARCGYSGQWDETLFEHATAVSTYEYPVAFVEAMRYSQEIVDYYQAVHEIVEETRHDVDDEENEAHGEHNAEYFRQKAEYHRQVNALERPTVWQMSKEARVQKATDLYWQTAEQVFMDLASSEERVQLQQVLNDLGHQ